MSKIDVSFIIPAYNEEDYISNAINSIHNCMHNSKHDYEIIVINNGSDDNTAEIVNRKNVIVKNISRTSISNARNIGAQLAHGKIFAFIDADIRLTNKWSNTLENNFQRILNVKIVIGSKYSVREHPSYIEKYWFKPLSSKNTNYINGGNIITSKETFNAIGGFNGLYETGEDVEFCQRAADKGIKIALDSGFEAIHDGFPADINHFVKREIWHGKSDYINFKSFLNSPVAKAATVFALLHYFILVQIFIGNYEYIGYLFGIIAIIITLMSVRIFFFAPLKNIIMNIPLCYLYLTSRHISFLTQLNKILIAHHRHKAES